MRVNASHGSETSSKQSHVSESGFISMEKGQMCAVRMEAGYKMDGSGSDPQFGARNFLLCPFRLPLRCR
jgi:hypothetical protein